MRILLYTLVISILGLSPVFADQWCQWDGTKGINCQSDHRGYIVVNGVDTKTDALANAAGYYRLTVTNPILTATQVTTTEQWSLAGNQMGLTWGVRDKTTAEIDLETAQPMSLNDYYQWKALIYKGLITEQEAATLLPTSLINAYLARERLLQ